MILADTIHGFGTAVSIKDHGAERGLRQSRILWGSHTSRITSTILLREVAILCGAVEGTGNNRSTLSTGKKVGGVETVGMKAIRTGIGVHRGDNLLFFPRFPRDLLHGRERGAKLKE